MNKPTTIMFGVFGALTFLVSSLRPSVAADAVRFARWHHRWR
jgi:hypothetical protein